MGKRRREERGEKKEVSIMDFLGAGEKAGPQPEARRVGEEKADDISDEIYRFILSKSQVTKNELFEWAKGKRYSTAQVLGAIDKLAKSGRIRRRLDDEGGLVYLPS